MKFSDPIRRAINIAATLHKTQLRKNEDTPYVSHVYGVAFILADYTDDENIVIAGLLHDVLEDIPADKYNEVDMRRDFGDKVTDIVKGVTEDKSITDYRARKQHYLDQLQTGSTESVMVSAADMTHNMLSLAEDLERLGQDGYDYYQDWTDRLWFYKTRAEIIKNRLDSPLAADAESTFGKVQEIVRQYS